MSDGEGGLTIGRLALRASLLLSIALLAGRLSGLLRELELAAAFGVSKQADVAVLLLTLPDLLVNLLLAGGLSAALVPRLRQMAAEAASALFRQVSVWVFVIFGAASLVLVIWPGGVFGVLAPGLVRPQELVSMVALVCVAAAIPLTAASGVTAAYLNANQRFLLAGCGTLIFNLCVIAALNIQVEMVSKLTLLAGGIAAGAATRWGMQLAIVPRVTWRSSSLGGVADRRFMHAFAAGVLAAGLALLAPIIVRAAASMVGTGAVAAFNYAQKMIELPVGILITTISTVALTRLSGLYAEGRTAEGEHAAYADLRRGLLLSTAIVLIGISFVGSFITLALGRGAMDMEAIERVTGLTVIALLGVPFLTISSMATASLNARLLTSTVLKMTALSLLTLPLFALPGLLLNSERSLMGAVVAFQAVLAAGLVRRARFRLLDADGVLSHRMMRAVAACAGISSIFIALDWLAGLQNDIFRLATGGLGFVLAVAISSRMIR